MRIWRLADTVFFPPDRHTGRRPEQPACCLVETSRTHRLPGPDPRLLAAFLADRVRRPPRGTPVGPYYRPHEIQATRLRWRRLARGDRRLGRCPARGPRTLGGRHPPDPRRRARARRLAAAARVPEDPHPDGPAQPARPAGPGPRGGAALPVSTLAAARPPRAGARLPRGAGRPPPRGGVRQLPRRPAGGRRPGTRRPGAID